MAAKKGVKKTKSYRKSVKGAKRGMSKSPRKVSPRKGSKKKPLSKARVRKPLRKHQSTVKRLITKKSTAKTRRNSTSNKKTTGRATSAKKQSAGQIGIKIAPDDKNILRYMELAIDTERKGIAFYKAAKEHVNDYNMGRLMDVLIEQEKTHLKFFTEIRNAEKEKGSKEAGKIAAAYKAQTPISSPLFKQIPARRLKRKLPGIHELFKEALDFEVHGHDMYMYFARRIKNKRIKEFLHMVAKEELKHRNFIHMHQDALYDAGYWLGLEHVRIES